MTHPLRNLKGDYSFIRLRIETAMKDELEILSQPDGRSVTYLINEAIAEYLEHNSDYQRH
jgi:predicted DNA-binding protein